MGLRTHCLYTCRIVVISSDIERCSVAAYKTEPSVVVRAHMIG
jgi:hypothetical protein